jgi:limonene-1,2-epoxide hydrolase
MAAMDVVERLVEATNSHDLDALVACFATGYRNETPAHPARGFVGREQVAANWRQIFAAVPDVTATITASAADGDTMWSEWEMRGTRGDGSAHLMRGVIVFEIDGDEIAAARFYLEVVDTGPGAVGEAVRSAVVR